MKAGSIDKGNVGCIRASSSVCGYGNRQIMVRLSLATDAGGSGRASLTLTLRHTQAPRRSHHPLVHHCVLFKSRSLRPCPSEVRVLMFTGSRTEAVSVVRDRSVQIAGSTRKRP